MNLASTRPQFYREQNHVPPEFENWVDKEIRQLVKWHVLVKWDPKAMREPFPVVIAPLLVEPTKPSLIYDIQYVNAFLTLPATKMRGIGLVWTTMSPYTNQHDVFWCAMEQ